MWSIIGGMALQVLGIGMIYGGFRVRETGPAVIFAGAGITIYFFGLNIIMVGLKKFFLGDILEELKKINSSTDKSASKPVS